MSVTRRGAALGLKQRAGGPDDGDPDDRRPETYATQPAWLPPRNLGHSLAHRLGESGQEQALDCENEADRGAEIPHVTASPGLPALGRPAASEWRNNGRNPTSD